MTRRPVPLPDDVRQQLVEIAASKDENPYVFTETTYIPAPDQFDWLLQMIEQGHR